MSQKEIELIEPKFHKVLVQKSEIILNVGEVVYDQYYVASGCLRIFYRDASGKEHTVQFAIADWWLSDYTAFFTTSKAIMTIECIQPSVLYRVSKKDMNFLYKNVPQTETFIRLKLEKAYAFFQKRILGTLYKTTKERYLDFVLTYPDIEKMVKNYHIASYLGVTTETLSRIRKEIIEN
ncbi:Crp/Fnr family transcriptional regulator [Wenyingzhuangia aestuarii]|uniref:Crp/Fnr family transcriptional regulator n=1 Tax=Wenyingzhuangia aestuarii TaxID=1647582 RepID=UPI001FD7963F|nr:Crp/Fnr family transcriptional regulator [Wenyingzhuangia aestuarii]NJB82252.1 CRP-like cAMP-binding protein [Wenyingzhuangia aestuarii]